MRIESSREEISRREGGEKIGVNQYELPFAGDKVVIRKNSEDKPAAEMVIIQSLVEDYTKRVYKPKHNSKFPKCVSSQNDDTEDMDTNDGTTDVEGEFPVTIHCQKRDVEIVVGCEKNFSRIPMNEGATDRIRLNKKKTNTLQVFQL